MIQQLRRKFITIAMCSLLLIILIILGLINGITFYRTSQSADELLEVISAAGGRFPEYEPGRAPTGRRESPFQMTPETPFQTRFFVVHTNTNYEITKVDIKQIAAISETEAVEYALDVLGKKKTTGWRGYYKYLISDTPFGKQIVFVDYRVQLQTVSTFLITSCFIALAGLLGMFVLVSAFSRRAIRPVAESIEKQKQFITDAGHELKTPLTIISANTEVLELLQGKTEWSNSIRNQTARMNGLVKDLLDLARLEEVKQDILFVEFSFSEVVKEVIAAFEPVLLTQEKAFTSSIEPGVPLFGNQERISQLVTILLDNAIRYSTTSGQIAISLFRQGKQIILQVCNACDQIPQNLERLFDRFYREDGSRSREVGGSGIGLSIAKAIADAHQGKITAQKKDGTICFSVIF